MLKLLRELWILLRGKAYVRVSITMISLGVGLVSAPKFAQALVMVGLATLSTGSEDWKIILDPANDGRGAFFVGLILILAGVIVFVYCYKLEMAASGLNKEREALDQIETLWAGMHALLPIGQKYNRIDLVAAINAINDTAEILRKNPGVASELRGSIIDNVLQMCSTIERYKYPVEGRSKDSWQLVEGAASYIRNELGEGSS